MAAQGGPASAARSMVAKRLLFRQPKVTKVYPDSNAQQQAAGGNSSGSGNGGTSGLGPLSTEAARGTRKLLASFDSDESAYQSGNSSPAAGGPQPAPVGADESASNASTAATVTSAISPKSALDRLTPLDAEAGAAASSSEGTASLGCIELGEVRHVQPSEPEEKPVECGCDQQPAASRTGGRCVHFSNENPSSDAVSVADELADHEPTEGTAVEEAEFRDRLKRLFGLHHRSSEDTSAAAGADASGSAASIDPDSSIDLRQHQPYRMHSAAPQPRSRRQSLAARIFGRLPTALGGRRRSDDSGGGGIGSNADLGSEATGSTTGGLCSICGEPNCETHAEIDDGCWPRRQMRLLGCYKTKEERERAQMLENNLVARVTTIVVVIIILGLVIGLIVLASTKKSSSSSSATATTLTAAAGSTVPTTTMGSGTNATG